MKMEIVWKILEDGSFVIGDRASGITSYAYPTSPSAERAKRLAKQGKASLIVSLSEQELEEDLAAFRGASCGDYDARNWERLGQ
jgi:hypothetical protein